jgi:hypothetical protein
MGILAGGFQPTGIIAYRNIAQGDVDRRPLCPMRPVNVRSMFVVYMSTGRDKSSGPGHEEFTRWYNVRRTVRWTCTIV